MSKAIRIHGYGGPDVLRWEDVPLPEPGPGEALIRQDTPSGWASMMTVLLLVSGVQSMILGVLGEYVGRTFLSANGKPQGTVRSIQRNTDSEQRPA